MFLKTRCRKHVQSVEEIVPFSFLDLPELVIERILRLLPAVSLCRMAGVCRELRRKCGSDHLWQNLFMEKWGNLVGQNVFRAWLCSLASNTGALAERSSRSDACNCGFWPFPSIQASRSLPRCTLKDFFAALECGEFWFAAQVFNRENGHAGFMLSCYDAEICYEHTTNAFRARYPPHGAQTVVVEENISWKRVRANPVITTAYELHMTGTLDDLLPGDHVEVQWKRSIEFPFGWWYGMVGHAETCNNRERGYCSCHVEDVVWFQFNQYTQDSQWRRAAIKRNKVFEEGDESRGFYGGIRKLQNQEEISKWMQLWPKEYLE